MSEANEVDGVVKCHFCKCAKCDGRGMHVFRETDASGIIPKGHWECKHCATKPMPSDYVHIQNDI